MRKSSRNKACCFFRWKAKKGEKVMDFGRGEGDQVFRILLEGTQYFLRFTGVERMVGNAIPMAVHFISAVAHQEGKTSGKILYHNMLRSGEELRFLSMQGDEKFKQFAQEAKRYGVVYSVVQVEPDKAAGEAQTGVRKRHDAQHCIYEVAIKASDAAKINRIIENLGLNSVSMTASETQPEAGQTVVDLEQQQDDPNEIINNMFSVPEKADNTANPTSAAEHSASVATLTARKGIPENDRPSVKDKLAAAKRLVAERDNPQQMMAGDFIPNLMERDKETEEEMALNMMRPASEEEQTSAFGDVFGAAWAAVTGATDTAKKKQGAVAEEPAFLK